MNRRRFLSLFGAAAAGAVLDPERLLWVPGAKTIVLPPAGGWIVSPTPIMLGEVYASRDVYFGPDSELPPAWKKHIRAAAKELADRIDADCLRLYEQQMNDLRFFEGNQWPRNTLSKRQLNRLPVLRPAASR